MKRPIKSPMTRPIMNTGMNRRLLLQGLGAGLVLGLAGCSGAELSASAKEGEVDDYGRKKSDVVLDEKGLPNLADLMKPGPLGEKWLGPENAPVTIIKYASMTCPQCRAFHLTTYPQLKARYIDKGKVRFILREFPIGHMSGTATIAMRGLGQEDTNLYFKLYDKYITQQKDWVSLEVRKDALYKVIAPLGISREKFDSCFENQSIIEGLKQIKERGRNLGVTGTPTIFVNGKKERKVLTLEEIRQMAAPLLV